MRTTSSGRCSRADRWDDSDVAPDFFNVPMVTTAGQAASFSAFFAGGWLAVASVTLPDSGDAATPSHHLRRGSIFRSKFEIVPSFLAGSTGAFGEDQSAEA